MNRHKFHDVACQGNLKFCQGIVREMSGNFVSAGVWQPCTVYAYTKAIKNHRKICLSSHSCHFVNNNFLSTILLHAYVQYVFIMYTRYQTAPSKAVVGVDRQIKTLSMHMQKPLRITGKFVLYKSH